MNAALMFPLINGNMPTLTDVCLVLHELVMDALEASHRVLQEHGKENTKSSKLSHKLILQMLVVSTTHTHTHPTQTDCSRAHPNEDWSHQDSCSSLYQAFSHKKYKHDDLHGYVLNITYWKEVKKIHSIDCSTLRL